MYTLSSILGCLSVVAMCLVLTGYLVPKEWSHNDDTIRWVENNKMFFIVPGVLYIPTVFGLQNWMKQRPALDLGGHGSTATVNYILWWEISLALFSIIGTMMTLPVAMAPLMSGRLSMVEMICNTSAVNRNDPRSFWGLLFVMSKVPELADTIFVVLRKKELVLLQWYHHFATLGIGAYGTVTMSRYNNVGLLFACMNYCVHSFMYSWYAATRTGWKSPKFVMMLLTLSQFTQMIAGLVFTFIATSSSFGAECGVWSKTAPVSVQLIYDMYASYAFLFGKLFYDNYITSKKSEQPQHPWRHAAALAVATIAVASAIAHQVQKRE